MKSIDKIRNNGIGWALTKGPRLIRKKIDQLSFGRRFRQSKKLPIDESLIVLESEGDLSDNAFALYDYLRTADYLDSYRVIWAVDDVNRAKALKAENPYLWPNTDFVCKAYGFYDSDLAVALATCKWFIYDHCNLMAWLKKRPEQEVVFLSHGCGYKGPKGANSSESLTPYDFVTVTGPLAAVCVSNWQQRSTEFAITTGYPRNDYLLRENSSIEYGVRNWLGLTDEEKLVLWMPTFRQSQNLDISEDYLNSETGLPLFSNRKELEQFSRYLAAKKIVLVLKLHHLQAELPIFSERFENIILVRDDDLYGLKLQLYQFVRCADALISDYSSISVDFMLLDKPIIYTLDDYEEYAASRGLFPKNAIDYMPGYHVYDESQLEEALSEIAAGKDIYRANRLLIIDKYHTYRDARSAERVLKACGIKK